MMALLDEEQSSVNLGQVGSYYIDETSRLTLGDINSELLRKRFTPLKRDFQQFGLVEGNIWIKADIAQRLPADQSAVLHIKAPRVQVVDIYTPSLLNNQVFAEMGEKRPYFNRPIKHSDYIIPLPANVPPVYTVFIKVSSHLPINLVLEVKTLSELTKDLQKDNYLTGFLMGILLLLFTCNVFFSFRTKHPMYFIYSVLLIGVACFHLALHGLIYQLLPNFIGLQERAYNFFALTCIALITYFTRFYIETKENLPRIDRLLQLLIITNTTLAIIFAIAPQELNIAFLSVSTVSTLIMLLFVGLYSVYQRIQYSNYYLVARVLLTAGHTFWILTAYGILSLPFWYKWGLTISIVIEALIHFTGIITKHTPTNFNTSKQDGFQNIYLLNDVSARITRQTKIIDQELKAIEPHQEILKRAYKNLSNLAERIHYIQAFKTVQEVTDQSSGNLQLLIDQATTDFYTVDQHSSEIEMQYDTTVHWELLSNSQIIKHIYQVIMEEMHHQTDQALNIHSDVEANDRDGQYTLHIRTYPLPNSLVMDNNQYLGARYLADIVETLNGHVQISGEGRKRALICSIPIHARQVELSALAKATQTGSFIPVIIGHQDSELIERTNNFLHSRLLSLTHIDKLEDLHLLIGNRPINSRFLIILFEDTKNFGASDLVSFIHNLQDDDACLLISNNVNMSQEYASALGFNGFIYSSQIETKLLFDMERIQRESSNIMLSRVKRRH